eukprot:15477132-Alexandrium_andersonii.AAC.1
MCCFAILAGRACLYFASGLRASACARLGEPSALQARSVQPRSGQTGLVGVHTPGWPRETTKLSAQ